MQHLALFILFLRTTTGSEVRCISANEPLQSSLDNYDYEALQKRIERLTDTIDVGSEPCSVRIKLDYNQKLLSVSFTKQIRSTPLTVNQISLQTVFQYASVEHFHVANIFDYACIGDKCELQFIMRLIAWLLTYRYEDLQSKMIPFTVGNTPVFSE
jgi:hypothetical protein